MSIEYVVMHPCRAKDELPDGKLFEMVKARGQVETVLEHMRRDGETSPPSELTVTRMVITPDGKAEEEEISLQEKLDETAVVCNYETDCEGCPARLAPCPFGCYRAINYPISSATERWLLSRLPADDRGPAGSLLHNIIDKFACDGLRFGRLRSDTVFFDSRRPQTRSWGGLLSKWRLTTDQVLEMLFCNESIDAVPCGMLAYVLGVLPHDTDLATVKDDAARLKALSEVRTEFPRGDEQIEQFGIFLEGLRVCAVLGVPMWVSA